MKKLYLLTVACMMAIQGFGQSSVVYFTKDITPWSMQNSSDSAHSITHLLILPGKQASIAQVRNLLISITSILSTARNCLPMPAALTVWRRERISSMERKES